MHEMSEPFFLEERKENIVSLSSAELVHWQVNSGCLI